MKLKFVLVLCGLFCFNSKAQLLKNKETFTFADTLRGSITPERSWWDLQYYHLKVSVDPAKKYISGSNVVRYKVLQAAQTLQIDLQTPLKITKITQGGEELSWQSRGENAHFITLKKTQKQGESNEIEVFYEGNPLSARNAPWDGGFSWKKDKAGNFFVATSCQGLGASVWWPCKDHMYDEPDSMAISVTVPEGYTDVSNGRLRGSTNNADKTTTFNWAVVNPINNYGVNVNIAQYEHFSEIYAGEKGNLSMDYYVLPENLTKAKVHFKQAAQMMKAFEHWFGPYPFYEDGFKLVEVPYLGMEHQSSVTYGNKYMNGYLGQDLSGTGWGKKWDFIIVHEAGHEWFANNITYVDIADMWVHEGFTAYSESLFTEFYYGKKAGAEYVIGTRKNLQNDRPVIGPYGVNKEGSGDMYYKGSNLLHMIRQYVPDDEKWRSILRGLNSEFYHQLVTSKQIEDYLSKHVGQNLSKIFDQYLRDPRVPLVEYVVKKNKISYRLSNCRPEFEIVLKSTIDGEEKQLRATTKWKKIKGNQFDIDQNFLVKINKVK
jgi:aminopeptidase N